MVTKCQFVNHGAVAQQSQGAQMCEAVSTGNHGSDWTVQADHHGFVVIAVKWCHRVLHLLHDLSGSRCKPYGLS